MTASRTLFAAAALLGMSGTLAQAQDALTVTGTGENFAVSYAAEHTGNILGGGFAKVVDQGRNSRIVYADPALGQKASGLPVFTGGQEGAVVYLPAPAAPLTMADNRR
ncbi:hypothetical protein E0493_02920 [Roseomonas sp. M0104]|uniref:Uncharacterized protein n=1 Tax=Teichococcus coralli TaxID=2545983 RepID=A0A845B3S3_9PROT|nr:hypothetical protein [Pseudoroseomonas coralli]MXP62303.1 hypothetical protein [Pseudoroseomonas coralli]